MITPTRVATARELWSLLRRARRAAARAAGDVPVVDRYTATFAAAVVGGLLVQSLRLAATAAPATHPPGLGWLLAGLVLVVVGAALALGPVLAGPAVRHWILAAPVGRRALLAPRYTASAAAAAVLGTGIIWLAAVVADPAGAPWWAVTGACGGAGLYAAAVLLQTRLLQTRLLQTRQAAAGRVAATAIVGLGGAIALAALVGPPETGLAVPVSILAVGTAICGAVLLTVGWRRLDRPALGAGSGLAVAARAARAAATFLDPELLLGLLEERRWRAARRGRSRSGVGTGLAALTHVDARRVLRTPGRPLSRWGCCSSRTRARWCCRPRSWPPPPPLSS